MKAKMSRRTLLKSSVAVLGTAAVSDLAGAGKALAGQPEKSSVFFTRDITAEGLLKACARVSHRLTGRVAIKLHSGEPHGPNLLPLELIKSLQAHVPGSTIVECNVLYPSPRQTTETHLETLKTNGFGFCPVDIMDAEGDATLPVPGVRELLAASASSRDRLEA